MKKSLFACLLGFAACLCSSQQNPSGFARLGTESVQDRFVPLISKAIWFDDGMLGNRIKANIFGRLINVDENDMLDAFEHRENPNQDWQGEHVGKFLHAATLAWSYSQSVELKAKIDRVVARLLKTQLPDGYLGTYQAVPRWTSWDVWVHKYDLLGLLTYYQYFHSQPALEASVRIGDLLCETFGDEPGKRDVNKAGEHVGMAADSVLEPMILLYRATGESKYLNFARYIIRNYDAPSGPKILTSLERFRSVRKVANAKAYEMTSNFNGLLEFYRATGDKRIIEDMETAWKDIVANRLYITGSGSSGEIWQDDFHLPNNLESNICETCVTVTWEQMNLQLLRLTGDPKYADQLERSIYNHLFAAQKPSGESWAYYTPLEGRKPYSPSTTCCLSSGPRGVALIPSIGTMTSSDGGVVVNLYNSGTAEVNLREGRVWLEQRTNYPIDGIVSVIVKTSRDGIQFPLRLRIPSWASKTTVSTDSKPAKTAVPGSYFVIDRSWKSGDSVTIQMDLPTRIVRGDHENEGSSALIYGPMVLAFDSARNGQIAPQTATLTLSPGVKVTREVSAVDDVVFSVPGTVEGKPNISKLYLRPFAYAGDDGKSSFSVWMKSK